MYVSYIIEFCIDYTPSNRNKLLHLGNPQLQEVVDNMPGAVLRNCATLQQLKHENIKTPFEKLEQYFSAT